MALARAILVGQDALLVQVRELVQLVDHGRGRGRKPRPGRAAWLLLPAVADAGVLVRLRRCLVRLTVGHMLPAMYAPPPTTAARSNGRRCRNIATS